MHYSPIARDWATNRDLFKVKRVHLETVDSERPLHCVLMHGWHSLYSPMIGLENALRALPNGRHVRFWRVTYDTHWKTFGQSSREIAGALRMRSVVPSNTLLVGYSMGGIVSRCMISEGFDAAGALCLCSPHLGPAPWMPSGDLGSLSIAPWSARLAKLNRHPVDIKRRGDYFFHSVTFKDASGMHHHDRIVTLRSALGEGLVGVGMHNTRHLDYKGIAPTCDPHLHGMYPQFLEEPLKWAERKFEVMALKIR